MMKLFRGASAATLALCLAAAIDPAMAHHSVANYDRQNQIFVEGTVEKFHWGNPHTWIYLLVPNDKGVAQEWRLEGPSVNGLSRNGWRATTLKPGDKAKLVVAPNRDGTLGGEFLRVVLINGKAPSLVSR